jgi:hypothetical protein
MSIADMIIDEAQAKAELTETEDELTDLMADLLGESHNEPFLRALFFAKAGQWLEVSTLCVDLESIKQRLDRLQAGANDSLFVTWLEYPEPTKSEGFCLIVFFTPMFMWNSTAIYNKAHLLRDSRRNGIHH